MQQAMAAAGAVAFVALALGLPAHADDLPNAAITGTAVASGAFAPINVNPNVQLYPAYSFSETFNDASHTLSGGVYPGFLADAAASFYGYGVEERNSLGIAESQWPNPPQKSDAGFTNFGDKCPFFTTDFGLPDSIADTCTAYWAQYGRNFPGHVSTASAQSGPQTSNGSATGTSLLVPGGVAVGSFETTSSTARSSDGRTVTSTATVVLGDVQIGPISIKQIRSVASSTSGGSQPSAKSTRQLEIVDATFGTLSKPVVIDDSGVHALVDGQPVGTLNDQLAAYGFDVRVVNGGYTIGPNETATDSGALIVQWTGSSPPDALRAPSDALCNVEASGHDALANAQKTVTGNDHIDVSEHQPNPIRQPNPISDRDNPLTGRKVYDPNAKPFTLLDPTVGADQTVPPVLPCLDFLLERDVNVGVALGSAYADATYRVLPATADFTDVGVFPDVSFTSTLDVAADVVGAAPLPFVSGPSASLHRIRRTTVTAADEVGPGVASRVKLLYGLLFVTPPFLLIGRRAFRVLIRW